MSKKNGDSFVHCHAHTAFSMLDGKANVDDLVRAVAEEGQPGIAITDHGNTFGAYEMYKTAKKYGVKPIIGSEFYLAPGDTPRGERTRVQWGEGGEDDVSGGGAFTHLTAFAETTEGMHNLFKLSSESFKTGYYYKARCLTPGQKVTTWHGEKNIEDLVLGDVVLTHKGTYSPVSATMVNPHEGDVYTFWVNSGGEEHPVLTVTGEHPLLIHDPLTEKKKWMEAGEVKLSQDRITNETPTPVGISGAMYMSVPKPKTSGNLILVNMLDVDVPHFTYDRSTLNLWVSNTGTEVVRFTHHLPLSEPIGELLALFLMFAEESNDPQNFKGASIRLPASLSNSGYMMKVSSVVKTLCGETVKITMGNGGGSLISFSNPILAAFLTETVKSLHNKLNLFWGFTRAPEQFINAFLETIFKTALIHSTHTHISPKQVVESFLPAHLVPVIVTQLTRINVNFITPHSNAHTQGNPLVWKFTHFDNEYTYLPVHKVTTEPYTGNVYNVETKGEHSYVSNVAVHNCDRELLSEYAKGIIATTGCPSGEVQTRLRLGQIDEALKAAAVYREIFGPDNYFVEIMDHGLGIEKRTKDGLLWIADQLKLPLLATNDLHYVSRNDAKSHEAMLCVQSGSKLSDPKRFKFDAEEFYLKTADEMRELFPQEDYPDACNNTLLIAERCNVEFNENADLMPKFPVPEGETIETWFVKEVQRGLERRYPNGIPEEHQKLAEYEMSVIQNMGFPGYFLVTADFIMWAKKQGIRVGPGRGCLRGDALVTTPEGRKEIRWITTDDLVADGDGNFVHPTAVHEYDCDEDLYAIGILNNTLYLTADHHVLRRVGLEGDETEWVRADEIVVGDYVCDPLRAHSGAYYYHRVNSVTGGHKGDGRVYDLSIPTTTSYVANKMVVHNSAAGSIVAYALGITEIDPVQHNLIFERFLNPERVSMPDIDVDFDDTRRGEVINYVTEKYGADKVAQIVTFSIVKAKAAVKDAARILDQPFKVGEKITKLVPPPVVGKDMPLWGVFDPSHERYKEAEDLRKLYSNDPVSKKVIDTALGLEGVTRQWGVHAAGVILSAEPLTDHIPVLKREADGAIITQFDQKTCETLGLLKMDFLGLRNLTVISETLSLIKSTKNIEVVPEEIPYDDKKTFTLLSHGETLGVFQLDSPPMRALLKSMRPDKFEDISAVLALYRPGPMAMNSHNEYADRKNKRKPITPIHPELEETLSDILGDTYGLCIYQEQVQKIAQQVAGYSLGHADLLRRAMGKKDKEILDKEYVPFKEGMLANGYSEQAAQKLWEVLVPFADYAFNKAHTVAYGTLSYWTAYLKANYPAEYMSALLTSVNNDKDKTALYINECRRMGLEVLPPDVNESGSHYTPVSDRSIRIGLAAVRNVGENVVKEIVKAREVEGKFTSFNDFLTKVPTTAYNKRTLDSLIKAAAFSELHPNRAALSFIHAEAVDVHTKLAKQVKKGQVDMFSAFSEETGGSHAELITIPDIPEWDRVEKLGHEREMLGRYVTDHPLRGYQKSVSEQADGFLAKLFPPDETPTQSRAKIAGVVTNVGLKKTKKGDTYANVTIEDMTASVEVMFLPTSWEEAQYVIHNDAMVSAIVKVDHREDGSFSILGNDAKIIDIEPDPPNYSVEKELNPTPLILINTSEAQLTAQVIAQVKDIVDNNEGDAVVKLRIRKTDGGVVLYELPQRVDKEKALWEFKGFFGEDSATLTHQT